MSLRLKLEGQKFGRLKVIKFTGRTRNGFSTWGCKCNCGNVYIAIGNNLVSGHTKSCGCLKKDINTTHGQYGTPEYRAWNDMIKRCTNPKNKDWKNYGGRGIVVCRRWRESFQNFYNDMGRKPAPSLTLERENNERGYTPNNCKWATRLEQRSNQRRVRG